MAHICTYLATLIWYYIQLKVALQRSAYNFTTKYITYNMALFSHEGHTRDAF